MFEAPEGRKLFLWTKAKRALEKSRLFMMQDEMDILEEARIKYNDKIEELFDQKVEGGWKPTGNESEMRALEDAASLWMEQNVQGYKKAFTKLDSLFGSSLDDANING